MKKISHSEISTYLDCQKKWDLVYNKGLRLDNVHFRFGSVGHKVLETHVIPDETLYPELKEAFGITSWKNYFQPILDELDERMKDYELKFTELKVENDVLLGVIDAVWYNPHTDRWLITDYKFSTSDKGLDDVLIDEQMYIYVMLFCNLHPEIPFEKVDIGYINIPKTEMNNPRILKNGQLSKDKAQNVTYKKYLDTIHELGLNEEDYRDYLDDIKDKTLITITPPNPINVEMLVRIATNLDNTMKDMQKDYVLEKCSFMCKRCEYFEYCKRNKPFKKEENNEDIIDNNTTI